MVNCTLKISWINVYGTETTETFELSNDDNNDVISNESPFMIDIRKCGPLIIKEFTFHYAFDGSFDKEIQNVPMQTQECRDKVSIKINESLDKISKSIVFPNKTISVAPSFTFSFAGEETAILYSPVNENNIYDRIKEVLNVRYVEKIDSKVFITYMNPKEEGNRFLVTTTGPFALAYIGCAVSNDRVIAAGWRLAKKMLNSSKYELYYHKDIDPIEYQINFQPRYINSHVLDFIIAYLGFDAIVDIIKQTPTVSLPNPESESKCSIQ